MNATNTITRSELTRQVAIIRAEISRLQTMLMESGIGSHAELTQVQNRLNHVQNHIYRKAPVTRGEDWEWADELFHASDFAEDFEVDSTEFRDGCHYYYDENSVCYIVVDRQANVLIGTTSD